MIEVGMREAYAEACRALGEALVRENLTAKVTGQQIERLEQQVREATPEEVSDPGDSPRSE